MYLEWFDRVCGELRDSLHLICGKYDENSGMLIERGAKHPRIDFFSNRGKGNRDYFCNLFFDPPNEEFYFQSIDPYYGHMSKVILNDLEDIIDVVYESFQNYIDADFREEQIMEEESDLVESAAMEGELLLKEINVDLETPEVSYKFDFVPETGEGVIKRINRKSTIDENLLEEETIISFSKEEANTLIAMIASHMDSLNTVDDHV